MPPSKSKKLAPTDGNQEGITMHANDENVQQETPVIQSPPKIMLRGYTLATKAGSVIFMDERFKSLLQELTGTVDPVTSLTPGSLSALVQRYLALPFASQPEGLSLTKLGCYSFEPALRSDPDWDIAVMPHFPRVTKDWPVKNCHNGIIPVIGDTGAGKTQFLDTKLSPKPTVLIRISEPFEQVDFDEDERAFRVPSVWAGVELAIILAMLGQHVAIDGLRTIMYGGTSAALEGGITSEVFDALTSMNNLMNRAGVTVLATLNPMLSDADKIDRLYARMAASTVGAYLISDGSVQASQFRIAAKPFRVFNQQDANSSDDVAIPHHIPIATDLEYPQDRTGYYDPSGVTSLGGDDDDDDDHQAPRSFPFNL